MDCANMRNSFSSSIYNQGSKITKKQILDMIPSEISEMHQNGDIHIHDLEAFGKTTNCCTPNLLEFLRKKVGKNKSNCGKIAETFYQIKMLITNISNSQSGGIGFGNIDIDLDTFFTEIGIEHNDANVDFLEEEINLLIDWLNNTRIRFCREAYYVTFNLGLSTELWGRTITRLFINSYKHSPISFTKPNIVFKVSKEINSLPNTPNYDLYQEALKCTAKRMIPTYLLMDSAVNKSCPPTNLNIMGCRTRVYDNSCGSAGTICRGNISYVSINLPRIAITTNNMTEFYSKLKYVMEKCCELMEFRNTALLKTNGEFMKYHIEENIWVNSSNLSDILKQGTYSIGFIGLSETIEKITNKKPYEDSKSYDLSLEIIKFMRKFVDDRRAEEHKNFSLLGTPGEILSGRFCELDSKLYPQKFQEKGFYTNSFHVDVQSGISIFDKIKLEAPFHGLCNGGSITYIEFPSAILDNTEALEDALLYATINGISYIGFNYPLDICNNCNTSGTFDSCEKCGSDDVKHIRRVSGYLEDTKYFTTGKAREIKVRKSNV